MSGLVERVEAGIDGLADAMVAAFVEAIPAYATLPEEQLQGEIRAICIANLRLLLTCLREQRTPDIAELAEPRASAARRAEERVPLPDILSAYLTGARLTWRAMVALAAPEDADDQATLHAQVGLILGYLQAVIAEVSQAYVEEQATITTEERDARRALAEALLTNGTAPPTLSRRAGVHATEPCRAVAIRLGPTGDEGQGSVSAAVAGRRKVRRVVQALEDVVGGPVLALLDPDGGAVVLGEMSVEGLRALQQAVEAATGAPAWLAVSDPCPLVGLPEAWRQASGIRAVVARMGHPSGLHTPDDVLLERSLTADSAAARRLAGALAPLAERDDLLATLQAWFDHDFDRRATAQELLVHPNTLDYRLRRITDLTGADVTSGAGLQLLGAALLARRLLP